MIDLHSHILPGLDDGAPDVESALEMARAAVAAGITIVAGTPHVREDYPTSPDAMEAALGTIRDAIEAAGIPLDVRGGGEIDLEWLDGIPQDELRRFGLAGNPAFLLLEFPYFAWPLRLRDLVFELQLAGFTPVLAHPERNAEVQAEPELLRPFVETGVLVQVTAASVDGRLGADPARAAAKLLRSGLVHLVASDAHSPRMRGFETAAAAKRIGDPALAAWLLDGVPGAIVSGEPIPPRPEQEPRRRRFGLGRRSR